MSKNVLMLKMMRKLFFAGLLFIVASCGANQNEETTSDSTRANVQGNSGGSDIIGVDTMRMDTSSRSISPK
jgi:hypothetical protein